MRSLKLYLLPLPLLLVACQEYSVNDAKDVLVGDDTNGEPDIDVNPTEIAFGQVMVNDEIAHTETVTLTNVGDAPLELYDLSLEDPTKPFTLSALGSVLVPPGQSTSFTVTYEPRTAEASEVDILVHSNDPDEEFSIVHLQGTGLAPVIQLDPENYDYGTKYIGCDAPLPLKIKNVGNTDLIVTDLSYVTASNDLDVDTLEATNGPLPWTIAPGNEIEVSVVYSPMDDYEDEGYLQVSSNDPFQTIVQAAQIGQGEVYGENLDVYEQPTNASTDILFVIDNSCSMSDEQANLSSNFTYFINDFVDRDIDYQLAVITTDNPAFRGDILDPDSNNIESEFIAQATPGINGSGNEMPSEMAYQSTQNGADAGPGSDFLRDDALLAMIFVSDEPDSSPTNWSTYLAHFQSLKSNPDNVLIHAISGDYPTGCGGASATNNVYEMSVATGGLYLSVCATDWSSHLETLAENSSQDLSSFDLTQRPVPESLVVRLDGVTTTVGWTYNSVDNSVDFEESATPEGGSTIEIEYMLYGDCSG